MNTQKHRSGFVGIIGKPNVGKSTLLNALIGRKLSIITPKASTTRHRILGIENGDDYQIVYSDTPGVIKPKYELHKRMMSSVNHALEDADLILLMVAMKERFPEEELLAIAERTHIPTLLVINKIDLSDQDTVVARLAKLKKKMNFVGMIPISATENFNIDELRQMILEQLPEGPAYFPKDQISDRPERFFVSEIIREQIFTHLQQEIPYSAEVNVDSFKEEDGRIRISAEIHVERKSQKAMVIGKGGLMIKRIGISARKEIQEFLEESVHLDLFVKVSDGWKNNKNHLKGFGY